MQLGENTMTRRTKGALAAGSTLVLLTFAVAMFWYQDWRYSFPTPRPEGLFQPPFGTLVAAAQLLPGATPQDSTRPLLVHFFNPNCPCSRFNLDHIRDLTRAYGDRVNIVAVLEEDSTEKLTEGFRRTGLPIEAVVD